MLIRACIVCVYGVSHTVPTNVTVFVKEVTVACFRMARRPAHGLESASGSLPWLVRVWMQWSHGLSSNVQPLWKTVWQLLKKLSSSCNPLLGTFAKELKSGTSTGICTPMFIAALSTIVKRWQQQNVVRS